MNTPDKWTAANSSEAAEKVDRTTNVTVQVDAIRAALHEWAFESHDADDDDLAADVRELLAALKAETERADKHCTHVLELLTERDVAKEQHANTLNRMLGERVERDMLAARCRDLEAANAELIEAAESFRDSFSRPVPTTFLAANRLDKAIDRAAAVAAPPTLTEPDGEEPSDASRGSGQPPSGSLSVVRDVPETAE